MTSLDHDDDERSGGSSLDDEFLKYLSGDIPDPHSPSSSRGVDGVSICCIRDQSIVGRIDGDEHDG